MDTFLFLDNRFLHVSTALLAQCAVRWLAHIFHAHLAYEHRHELVLIDESFYVLNTALYSKRLSLLLLSPVSKYYNASIQTEKKY